MSEVMLGCQVVVVQNAGKHIDSGRLWCTVLCWSFLAKRCVKSGDSQVGHVFVEKSYTFVPKLSVVFFLVTVK